MGCSPTMNKSLKSKIFEAAKAMKSKPTDTEMLNWCAEYLTRVNSLHAKMENSKIEIEAVDDDNSILVLATGKTDSEAFRKAVEKGMRLIPKKARRSQ